MREVKQEIIKVEYVTKYEAIDGTIFDNIEECKKYDSSAKAVLLARYKEIEIKLISEYDLYGAGSEEYCVSIVKLTEPEHVDLITQLYALFRPYDPVERLEEIRKVCNEVLDSEERLIIVRGCEYDNFGQFYIEGTLTGILNHILEVCKPGSTIEIKDDLTYPIKK